MSDYFERVERQLTDRAASAGHRGAHGRRSLTAGWRPHPFPGLAAAIASAAVVVAVVVVVVGGLAGHGGVPTGGNVGPSATDITLAPVAATPAAGLAEARAVLAARIHPVAPGASVALRGQRIVITGVPAARRSEVLALTGPGRLTFFDWETSAIDPAGKTAASGLRAGDPAAMTLSQGRASAQPGAPGAGGLSLSAALALLHRIARPGAVPGTSASDSSSRPAAVYLIGTARSQACALAAAASGFVAPAHGPCLLAGPAASVRALDAARPDGVTRSDGHVVTVPAGDALVQATAPFNTILAPGDSRARFFLVRGSVALTGSGLRYASAGTDQSGEPDVQFRFTADGAARFQAVTAAVAHRGQRVSAVQQSLNQHFAVALDGRLLTVPSIDFRTYPDGIADGGDGADITGGYTRASAQALAAVLSHGPLGVALAPR